MQEVVVIDSSEDENENPTKKIKLDNVASYLGGIKIESVKSLASKMKNGKDCDVVVIEDDSENDPKPNDRITDIVNEERTVDSVGDSSSSPLQTRLIDSVTNNNKATECEASCSEATNTPEFCVEFQQFMDVCIRKSETSKHKDLIRSKIPKLKEKYLLADSDFRTSSSFLKMLSEKSDLVVSNNINICKHFNDIYQELKVRQRNENDDKPEIGERRERHVKKLYKTLHLLSKKIKRLEEMEVNWEDDSVYIKEEAYKKRFVKVHEMICTLTKENRYAGRFMYRQLDFNKSQYTQVNQAIDKLYNRTKSVPTFALVDKTVRQCVEHHKLNLSDINLEKEAKYVFEEMVKLLKRRRQYELEDIHSTYLQNHDDPADKDPALNAQLQKQFEIGESNIEAVLQKYVEKQNAGEDDNGSDILCDSNDTDE